MRSYGLKAEELHKISSLFQEHFGDLEDVKAYLFGSRAKGKNKLFSDIDIAIKSKSINLNSKINQLKDSWESSNLPYKLDIVPWNELYKPYLPEINKTKILLWSPEKKALHPWRICPYGEHWVIRHPRNQIGKHVQDVDGHCRKNPSGKDLFKGDEIDFISKTPSFLESKNRPCPYQGKEKLKFADDYDSLIAGWAQYWNEVLNPNIPIEPNLIKALIESESGFDPKATASNKKAGIARGLIQITEETLKILGNKKGEIKDHYVVLNKEELFEPSKNICAGVRWLFRKREILAKKLGRSPNWSEVIAEYKGLSNQLKKNGVKATEIMNTFNKKLELYKC